MANIALTTRCNRACEFCFATGALISHRSEHEFMPLDLFESALDFLARSNIPEARLLGGEPTVHPDFERIVDLVLARGLRVVIFSGGVMPERALRRLEQVPAGSLLALINVIPPDDKAPRRPLRQEEVLARLGSRVILGVTIDAPAVRLEYLLEWIDRYGLLRAVRLGIAHPTVGGSNSYLHPRCYSEAGRRVAGFGLLAQSAGVRVEFDCGWVPCMFPEGALGTLAKAAGDVGLRCNPILDLMPDGQVISCYPLAAHSTIALTPEQDAGRMRAEFSRRQHAERPFTLYRECETCKWRARGECTGGCLAASLMRLRRRDFSVALPDQA
jgi:radical SAM protein with 4Fe4S-binding SPASM domain